MKEGERHPAYNKASSRWEHKAWQRPWKLLLSKSRGDVATRVETGDACCLVGR